MRFSILFVTLLTITCCVSAWAADKPANSARLDYDEPQRFDLHGLSNLQDQNPPGGVFGFPPPEGLEDPEVKDSGPFKRKRIPDGKGGWMEVSEGPTGMKVTKTYASPTGDEADAELVSVKVEGEPQNGAISGTTVFNPDGTAAHTVTYEDGSQETKPVEDPQEVKDYWTGSEHGQKNSSAKPTGEPVEDSIMDDLDPFNVVS